MAPGIVAQPEPVLLMSVRNAMRMRKRWRSPGHAQAIHRSQGPANGHNRTESYTRRGQPADQLAEDVLDYRGQARADHRRVRAGERVERVVASGCRQFDDDFAETTTGRLGCGCSAGRPAGEEVGHLGDVVG